MSCALNSVVKLSLMLCASARDPSRIDLASLGDELSQTGNVLIINVIDFSRAEFANLFPLAVGAEAAGIIICFIHDTYPPIIQNGRSSSVLSSSKFGAAPAGVEYAGADAPALLYESGV